jgi:chromosome partitioning protein
VEKYSEDHEYIVIDATPRIAQITMAALILSDLAIVPIESSIFDIWASVDLVETIVQAREKKPDLLARLVWNKYEKGTTEAKLLSAMAKEELGLDELTTKVGRRTAYKVAARLGETVREGRNSAARAEITELGREIQKLLKTKFLKGE